MFIFSIISIILPYLLYFGGVATLDIPLKMLAIIIIFLFLALVCSGVRSDIFDGAKMPQSNVEYYEEYCSNYNILTIIQTVPFFYLAQIIFNFVIIVMFGWVYASVILFGLFCIGGIISYINSNSIVKKWNSYNQEKFNPNKNALIGHIKTESYLCIFVPVIVIPYIVINKILKTFGMVTKQSQAIKNARGEF